MKKYILPILLLPFLFSCASKHRYFLFSYSSNTIARDGEMSGTLLLDCGGFPSKKAIDSMAYENIDKRQYQSIIIKSVFEFKNEEDYLNYKKP